MKNKYCYKNSFFQEKQRYIQYMLVLLRALNLISKVSDHDYRKIFFVTNKSGKK